MEQIRSLRADFSEIAEFSGPSKTICSVCKSASPLTWPYDKMKIWNQLIVLFDYSASIQSTIHFLQNSRPLMPRTIAGWKTTPLFR
jgi:hypothetical protein